MALQWQNVPIDFGQSGVDTKSDKKMTTRLTTLENALFTLDGELVKRPGRDSFTVTTEWPAYYNTTPAGTSLNALLKLGTRGSELLAFESDFYHSYSASLGNFIGKGTIYPITVDKIDIVGASILSDIGSSSIGTTYGAVESCVFDNYLVVTWVEGLSSNGGSGFFSIYDLESEAWLWQRGLIDGGTTTILNLKPVYLGDTLHFFYIDTTDDDIYCETIDFSTDPFTMISPVTTSAGSWESFDVAVSDKRIALSAIPLANNSVSILRVDEGGTYTGLGVSAVSETPSGTVTAASCCFSADGNEVAMIWTDGTTIQAASYDDTNDAADLAHIMSATQIDSDSDILNVGPVSCMFAPSGSSLTVGDLYCFYQFNGASFRSVDTAVGTPSSLSTFDTSSRLYSKPFVLNSEVFISMVNESGDGSISQSILVSAVHNQTPQALANFSLTNTLLQGVSSNRWLINASTHSDGVYLPIKDGDDGSIKSLVFSHNSSGPRVVDTSKGLYVCSGLTWLYDGTSAVEATLLRPPQAVGTVTETGTGANYTTGETINLIATYEWRDDLGNLHRSAPSEVTTHTLASDATSIGVNVQTYSCNTVIAPSPAYFARNDVRIKLWQTASNGSIYYLAQMASSFPTSETQLLTATIGAGSALQTGEPAYFSTGELDDYPIPAVDYLDESNSRLFFVPSENKSVIQYTKKSVEGLAYSTHPDLVIKVGDKNDFAKAVKGLDSKVIVYKERSIAAIFGDGPDALGLNNSFTAPQEVTNEFGIEDVESLVEFNLGHVFKSTKGFYLLTRQLSLEYIGRDVENLNSETIVSALVEDDNRIVRFYTNNSKMLVMDYSGKDGVRWEVHTYGALDAIKWNNKIIEAATASTILQTAASASTFEDNTTNYKFTAETGWISFANRQGHQRVRKALLMGRKINHHFLRVQVAYDYSDSYTDDFVFDSSTLVPTGTLLRYEMRMTKQRCEAIRFKISETDDSDNGAFAINSLMLEVGVKRGVSKQRSTTLRAAPQ